MAEIKSPEVSVQKDAAAQQQLEQMVAGTKKKKYRKMALIALLLLAAVGFFVVRPMLNGEDEQASGYIDQPVEKRDLTVYISDSGALQSADAYNIIGLVGGDILSADFEEGDYVEKDQLLFQIDSSDAEKSIEQAEITLENAGLSYQSTVDALDGLSPKAAVAGKIMKLYVEEGDEVAQGALLAEIRDSDMMELQVPFHQSDASSIYIGASAVVTMNDTGEQLTGRVKQVSGAVETLIGNVLSRTVTITVQNPGGLQGGMGATAQVGNITCAGVGTFASSTESKVYAGAAGTVRALHVKEGQKVAKEQAILSIDSDSAQRQIRSAELGVRSAELALENAEDLLDNYAIKAPISGTVVAKNYKAGDKLDGTAGILAVIYDMSYLTLTLDIDELDIGSVKVGQKVQIEAEALPGKTFTGRVDRVGINGTVAAGVTTYPVKVVVEDYQDLLPGMNVTADILIEEARDVLSVPISAVSRGNTVLVADPEAAGDPEKGIPAGYRQVTVTTGRSTDEYIEILSGLEEGQQVGVSTATASLIEQMMGMGPGNMTVTTGPAEE